MHDLVIRNGKIVDGSGKESFMGDIAIDGDRITKIGLIEEEGKSEIDAEGNLVTPGWVDVHTHYDAQLTWDPTASPSLDLGVTTAIIGNCGFTIAPCRPEHRELNIKNLTKVEGMPYKTLKAGIDWQYETYAEYMKLLESKSLALNICSYVGHSALRIWAMGEQLSQKNRIFL